MAFTIYTNPDDYDFIWHCELTDATNEGTDRTTPRKAWKDAVAHAKKTLADYRTTQGTDEWPVDYPVSEFICDFINFEARGPAGFSNEMLKRVDA